MLKELGSTPTKTTNRQVGRIRVKTDRLWAQISEDLRVFF
jgi:hypothetical protein